MTAHILHMKRTVKLLDFNRMDETVRYGDGNVLRPGQRAFATFSFLGGPQFVRSGMRVIFRDGYLRGFGIVR